MMRKLARFRRLAILWRTIEAAASIVVMLIIGYAVVMASVVAEDGLTWDTTHHVDSLTSGGPADEAGIELGDRVLAVNGHPPNTWRLPLLRWRPGDTIQVTVERGGEPLKRSITLERLSPSRRWELIAPLVVASSFWVVSSLMPGMAQQTREARLFRALSLIGSAMLAAGNLSTLNLAWAGRLFGALSGMLAPVIFHFHLTLPGARLRRGRRPVLWTAYAVGVIAALPYPTMLPQLGWGWGHYTTRLALAAALIGSLAWLGYSYVSIGSRKVKRRLRFLLLGTAWGFLPILSLSLLPDMLKMPQIPYPFTMLFLTAIPLVYWYATMRFDLLRVDLILNRSTVYLILVIGFGSLSSLILFGVNRVWAPSPAVATLVKPILLGVAGLSVIPLHHAVRRTIDQLFYGGWYDYRSVVSDVSHSLSGMLDRDTLADLLLERVTNSLWVRSAALLLPASYRMEWLEGETSNYLNVDPSLLRVPADGDLAHYLCQTNEPIPTSALQEKAEVLNLTAAEEALIENEAIHWWVPIAGNQTLNGLLLLGARMGGEGFGPNDVHILKTLSSQATLAVDNVLLVENLRAQLEALEENRQTLAKMHQRLLNAREEERKYLARELHDSPIQKLIALRYQLGACTTQVDPEISRTLHDLRAETSSLVNELRRLCRKLRPPLLDAFGLDSAIRAHSEELGRRHAIEVSLVVDDDSEAWSLSEEVTVSLFRIYQEAMTNVTKHAQAERVTIHLTRMDETVQLAVEDDGVGFELSGSINRLASEGHFGLLGIQERIELLGGGFALASRPHEGTRLEVTLPIA